MNPPEIEVPDTIVCVECGGLAHCVSYPPPDVGFLPGDVVVFACEDCNHRLDVVYEDAPEYDDIS